MAPYLYDDEDYNSSKRKKSVKRKGNKNGEVVGQKRSTVPERPWYVGDEKNNLCYTWESKMYLFLR